MPGETSERLVRIAARTAGRVAQNMRVVNDRYAPPSPLSVSREEQLKEMEETGHEFDVSCTRPTCMKIKQMFANALQQVLSEAALGPQNG